MNKTFITKKYIVQSYVDDQLIDGSDEMEDRLDRYHFESFQRHHLQGKGTGF